MVVNEKRQGGNSTLPFLFRFFFRKDLCPISTLSLSVGRQPKVSAAAA